MSSFMKSILFLTCICYSYSIIAGPTMFNPLRERTVHICNESLFNSSSIVGNSKILGFNTINCVNGDRIKIISAHYGIKKRLCAPFGIKINSNPCAESIRSFSLVKQMCDGRYECHINVPFNSIKFPNFCPNDVGIALEVTYICKRSTIRYHPFSNGNAPNRGLSMRKFQQQQKQMKNNLNRGVGTQVNNYTLIHSRFGHRFIGF